MEILMPVETEEQYREALRRVARFEGNVPEPDSPEGREFEALLKLIDQYEAQAFDDLDDPSPGEVVEFMLDQHGLSQAELARESGIPRSRVSDIVNGRRKPTRSQIEKLADFFDISPALLVDVEDDAGSSAAE